MKKVFNFSRTEKVYYFTCVSIMGSISGLTKKEKQIIAWINYFYHENMKMDEVTEENVFKIVLSPEGRKKIRTEMGMTLVNFNNFIRKLVDKKVLIRKAKNDLYLVQTMVIDKPSKNNSIVFNITVAEDKEE